MPVPVLDSSSPVGDILFLVPGPWEIFMNLKMDVIRMNQGACVGDISPKSSLLIL